MSREADSFLNRWSQRKQAAREDVPEEISPEVLAKAKSDEPEKTDAEILQEFGLKDPDEMAEGDDFSGFMSGAIPERLRNRALRKLWLTNPVLANLDELVDYGEDFTDAATVVENLQTAYRVGKGFLRQEEIDASETSEEAGDSVEVAEADATDVDGDSELAEPAFSSDGNSRVAEIEPLGGELALVEIDSDQPQNEPISLENATVPRQRRMVFRSA